MDCSLPGSCVHGILQARILEYWQQATRGLPCPPPGDLPNPGIKPMSLISPALVMGCLPLSLPEKPIPFLITPKYKWKGGYGLLCPSANTGATTIFTIPDPVASNLSIVFLKHWPAGIMMLSRYPPQLGSAQRKLNWVDVWDMGRQWRGATHLPLANSMWLGTIFPWY